MRRPSFSIRAFAVACVAVTSAYVMWLGYTVNQVLSGPGWCATALGAGKASSKDGQPVKGLEACVGLLTIQLKSLSTNSHILLGTVALCLAVLMIIVVAGARFSGEFNGMKADIAPADEPIEVKVTNPPADPVPVAPQPEAPVVGGGPLPSQPGPAAQAPE
jgi:hypothetical protein